MRVVLTMLVFFNELSFSSQAQTTNYQVYALYVVNIAEHSSWPGRSGDFHITVFGKSKAYEELLKQNGKMVNGHTLRISQVEELSANGEPQIIYLPDNKSSSLNDILKATAGKPAMIITEREGLFKKGAGFSFVVMGNNTLRYDINHTELEKKQIRVSKNLAALANATL
ncbi:MAG TPA: YfiR family protein [Ohtaekwangia sp.]|nr:YfiR family protein [Ohtaekwangia sp.]